jgi:hypothetical protein
LAGNAAGWSRLFDRVHVISLPGATERRQRLARYLPAHGIAEYRLADGFGPGSEEVVAAHIHHIDWRAILVFGPAGASLAETAARLGACGVDVGHEGGRARRCRGLVAGGRG